MINIPRVENVSAICRSAVGRTLIVDTKTTSASIIADIVRSIGGRDIVIEGDEKRALTACLELDPDIIFVERSGPRLDGLSFSRRLRRSHLACRKAPLIMITVEATLTAIAQARDAGIDQVLGKPFCTGDVLSRIEAVTAPGRSWIEAVSYVGPDRRRLSPKGYKGALKRRSDVDARLEITARKDQAMRILSSALKQFESDPPQALRAIQEQASVLKALAIKTADFDFSLAAAEVLMAASRSPVTRERLVEPVARLLTFGPPGAVSA